MQKESLIKLAFSMDIEPAYEKLYRFAQNYAHRLIMKEADNTEELFQCISYCNSNPQAAASRTGIAGREHMRLKNWSGYVLKCKDLENLSLEELCYVFGCCARFCKAKT